MAENPRFSPFSTNWTPERVMLGIKHVSNADVHSTPQSNNQSCQHWRLQWTGGGAGGICVSSSVATAMKHVEQGRYFTIKICFIQIGYTYRY